MVTQTGLKYDRNWMVVTPGGGSSGGDAPKYKMATQRQFPVLARVSCNFPEYEEGNENVLSVSYEQGEDEKVLQIPLEMKEEGNVGDLVTARVWDWEGPCYDEGDEAGAFFSSLVGVECRLVRFIGKRATDEAFAPNSETAFSDGFPFLIASEGEFFSSLNILTLMRSHSTACVSSVQLICFLCFVFSESLEKLNTAMDVDLPMNRFRANLVVSGCGGAFEEDTWTELEVCGDEGAKDAGTSSCLFELVKPCSRCTVTTVNQSTGKTEGREPLKSLGQIHSGKTAGYGRKEWERVPFFGWNAICNESMVGKVIAMDSNVKVLGRKE